MRVSTARGNRLSASGVNDFSGGLSLLPPQELAENESAMATNVVFSTRGGVSVRPGFRPFATAALEAGTNIMAHVHRREVDGVYQLFGIKNSDDTLWWTAGGQWWYTGIAPGVLHAINATTGEPFGVNAAQYLDKSYFVQVINDFNYEWDGYQMKALSQSFNNDLADPSAVSPSMPSARLIAVKGDFTFIGDIQETDGEDAGLSVPGRLRWSHPGIPTSWREQDFVDLPSGRITALVPFRDFLAIFTDDAIYGLYGDSTETFQLQAITEDSGTPYHWSVTASASRLYWWDWDQGVMSMGAGAPAPLFGKLQPFFDQGGFDPDGEGDGNYPPNLVWGDGRLYVNTGNYNTRVGAARDLGRILVFDPRVGDGAWTSWTFPEDTHGNLGGTVYPRLFASDHVIFGTGVRELIINDQTVRLDRDHTYSTTDKVPPAVVLRTAPFAGDTNVTRKRFRRPRVTVRSGSVRQRIKFGYLRNYDEGQVGTFREVDLNFLNLVDFDAGAGLWQQESWSDAFSSEDTARWDGWSGTVHVVSNALNLDVTNVSGAKTLTSDDAYDVRGSQVRVNAVQVPTNSSLQFLVFNGNAYMAFSVTATTITMSWRTAAGVETVLGTHPYSASADWLSLECDGTDLVWATSADGVTYTVRQTIPIPTDFIDNNVLRAMSIQLRANQTTSGSSTGIFDTFSFATGTEDPFVWDTSIWATDLNGNEPPDNYVAFQTLPSAGAGHAFQMEFRSVPIYNDGVEVDTTNGPWGIDSIVLPYREKGVR